MKQVKIVLKNGTKILGFITGRFENGILVDGVKISSSKIKSMNVISEKLRDNTGHIQDAQSQTKA